MLKTSIWELPLLHAQVVTGIRSQTAGAWDIIEVVTLIQSTQTQTGDQPQAVGGPCLIQRWISHSS